MKRKFIILLITIVTLASLLLVASPVLADDGDAYVEVSPFTITGGRVGILNTVSGTVTITCVAEADGWLPYAATNSSANFLVRDPGYDIIAQGDTTASDADFKLVGTVISDSSMVYNWSYYWYPTETGQYFASEEGFCDYETFSLFEPCGWYQTDRDHDRDIFRWDIGPAVEECGFLKFYVSVCDKWYAYNFVEALVASPGAPQGVTLADDINIDYCGFQIRIPEGTQLTNTSGGQAAGISFTKTKTGYLVFGSLLMSQPGVITYDGVTTEFTMVNAGVVS